MDSESTTITTSETFNYPNADVIIRSSAPNQVDFRVHKFILSLSSSFFETMFTLPDASQKAPKTNLPVVDVSEPANTIDLLLRTIYPNIPEPIFDSLNTLRPFLGAALEFRMQAAVVVLRRVLLEPAFLKVNPLKVYALAASYNFEDEAKVASQHTLNLDLSTQPLTDEMKTMSAYYYHRLITMHRRRSEAARTLIQTFPPLTPVKSRDGKRPPPPKCTCWDFWNSWKARAEMELIHKPIINVIFTHDFCYQNSRPDSCSRSDCPNLKFLDNLKNSIEAIVFTI